MVTGRSSQYALYRVGVAIGKPKLFNLCLGVMVDESTDHKFVERIFSVSVGPAAGVSRAQSME